MKYLQFITSIILAIVLFLSPSSVQAASSSSVTKSILNAAGGEDFSGKNLIRSEFTSVTLRNTNFTNADLRGALFNGVLLEGANLHGSDFSDAILTDSNMLRSSFDNVDVTGADFTNALIDVQELKKICVNASGTNSKTGVDTRESLGCE